MPPEMNRTPQGETEVLVEFLDFYRAVIARKAEGLIAEELRRTTASSSLTLAGLVKHMALVEDSWFTVRLANHAIPEPWVSANWDEDEDWELTSALEDSPQELLSLFDEACDRSRAVVAAQPSLDTEMPPDQSGDRGPSNLRWIMVHMIEEYARHAGHADFLREAIDGKTGD
ncbi:MAG: DinB family protein [Actinobacteria bacterium]|nr:MAG: DinB family protein [Actinomycetota bacterium]